MGVRLEGLWRDGATGADLELFQSKRNRREILEEERVINSTADRTHFWEPLSPVSLEA